MNALAGFGHLCLLVGGPTYTIDGIAFEWSERFGPAVVNRQTGAILDNQPGSKSKFWKSVSLWREQGCRVTEIGACVYEIPPEPVYVQIAGRHYAEVPAGSSPEEVRAKWLAKLGRKESS